ncbi:MAG: hypothetical protein JXR76_24110 [Deltaproteobacteria bacterium]|nr:hypothetical protein [Deltaproteobacteria bacterium]
MKTDAGTTENMRIQHPYTDIVEIPAVSFSLENYVLAIFALEQAEGIVQVNRLADFHKVASASVIPAMRRLERLGLIIYERRRQISLTPLGRRFVAATEEKRRTVRCFFEITISELPGNVEHDFARIAHGIGNQLYSHIRQHIELEIGPVVGSPER